MTLRLRLVVGLVILVLAGLAIFGVSTYALYSRTQYDRLDEQLHNTVPTAACFLIAKAGLTTLPECGRPGAAPLGTYAKLVATDGTEVVDATGDPISPIRFGDTTGVPDLPKTWSDPGRSGRVFTTGSSIGSGDWRVSLSRMGGPGSIDSADILLVVAVPTKEVTESLRRLIYIEGSAAGGLLVILAAGSWFILRRGLRPLEQMATSTRAITAGDLSRRVQPSDGRTEVGQLGLALNTMLSDLETAFHERDATEHRLRQFLADASHELRTPLTSIQGFAELFRLGADHPDLDLPIVMRRIEQEAARMGVLVDDLLLLARLDRPRPSQPAAVDLAVIAADVCTDIRAVAPDRQVSLLAPEPVVVTGDADHLRQAVANLASNAVAHTPAGTPVELTVGIADGAAIVRVRDHGHGLDAAAQALAFDRFWQADSARVGKGSGLGLAIVQSIAHEHGGSVGVANVIDASGAVVGAEFTIRLPIGGPAVGST
jgi:two-component system OmpR family sensor kinase